MTAGNMKDRYEIFNIGTGSPVSVLELLTSFEKVNDLKLPYRMTDRRPGDVPVEVVFQSIDKLPEGFVCPADRTKPWGTAHAVIMAAIPLK